jgi:predicted small secreted protein
MDKNTVLIFFGSTIALIAGIWLLVRYLRNSKGTITLHINDVFAYSQPITGSFDFLAKKEIEANDIICELYGYVMTFIYNKNTKNYDSQNVQFHYDKVVIEPQAMTYPIGFQKNYSFSIATPPVFPQHIIKQRTFSNNFYTSSNLDWYLKITIEAK